MRPLCRTLAAFYGVGAGITSNTGARRIGMVWFKRKSSGEAEPPKRAMINDDDPRIAEGHARLDRFWAGVGAVEPDVLSYIINPQFQGAPAWPNMRQAYRVVRRDGSLILASDGLSDPFVGTNMSDCSGFDVEVLVELPGLQEMTMDEIRRSWAFALIEMVAQNVADWGGIGTQLARHGVVSSEMPLKDEFPADWVTEDGMVGVLFGQPVTGWVTALAMPFGPVQMVAVTLLRPAELAFVAAGGAETRQALSARLVDAGVGHLSDIGRDSVV